MKNPRPHSARSRPRGFTLIEVIFVVTIILLLTALVFVGVSAAIRGARRHADQAFLRSLGTGIEHFKQQFGFLPPLVDDSDPLDTTTNRPRLMGELAPFGGPTGPSRFLRWEDAAATPRSSKFSIPYFVLGVLPRAYDGVDGAGFTAPGRDGSFSKSGRKIDPTFDFSSNSERLKRSGANDEESVLVDRWGSPIYYYRWLPTQHVAIGNPPCVYPGAKANDSARDGEIRSFNVPLALGNPADNPALRDAGWGLVSAGQDQRINNTVVDDPDNKDNIVETGP